MTDPAAEIEALYARLSELEETLRALRSGEADAVVVEGREGPQVYTLKYAAEPYRLLIEQMGEGALTVSRKGLILYSNEAFANVLGRPRERVVGTPLGDYVLPGQHGRLAELLQSGRHSGREVALRNGHDATVETLINSTSLSIEGEEVRCLVVTDLSQQELRLRHAAVVEATEDAIYTVDPQLVIQTWNRGAETLTGLPAPQAIGRSEWELCPADRWAELEQLVARVECDGTAASMDTVRQRPDGSRIDLIYSLTPLKDRKGDVTGYSVVAHDITARKATEERLRFLTTELDHRANNLLAMVQAVATLSARSASSVDGFLSSFQGRIFALAEAHNLLSRQSWRGAELRDVVRTALAGYDGDERIAIDGCQALLKAKPAHDLALSLHELTTNAAKYGALSVPQGRVALQWRRSDDQLVIEWNELQGPRVHPPERRGLGSHVIAEIVGAHGSVDYRFQPDGVRCCFQLRADCLQL